MVDITCRDFRQFVPMDAEHLDDIILTLQEAKVIAAFALAAHLVC